MIVAEAGVNHNGQFRKAMQLVDAAIDSGADAVKFQYFRSQRLWGDDRLEHLELAHGEFIAIAARCNCIEFMCTPFGSEDLAVVRDLGVKRIKIPSGLMTDYPYLETVAKTGLPVILSTGMSTLEEVSKARSYFTKPTLLHCVSAYPCPYGEANLLAMLQLKRFGEVGYSDHTDDIYMPIAATALGASVIEKHLTLDCTSVGPDHSSSIEPDEFKEMVRGIKQVREGLGDGVKRVMPSEEYLRKVWRDRG